MGLVKRTYVDGETVITADNLNDIQDEIIQNASDISTKGTYSKPSGGIPASDLASGVQTSLGKADTAYQKPSGGIPSTDLASAVQTSLGKADTALQSSDIDSTLTVAGKAADAKATGDEISGVKNTLTQLGTEVGTVENSIAIIINGNTSTSNVSKGQYVYVKNSTITGKPDGLYTYNSDTQKTAGNTFVAGELDAVPSGGLNSIKASLDYVLVATSDADTETTYTVADISDKKEFILMLEYYGRVFSSIPMPASVFKNEYKHTAIAMTENFSFYAYATYVSNTSVKMYKVGTVLALLYAR